MEGSPLVASLLLVAMPFAPSSVVAYPDEAPVRRLLPQVRTGREVRGSLEGRGVGWAGQAEKEQNNSCT